jgi:predicted AlkP superfamily pyrophosphatase or phosphodiesterase
MSSYQRLIALGLIGASLFGFLRLPAVEMPPVEGLPAADDGRPRLVVMVVFDQLRGDYLDKWQPLFVDGGFKRLQTEGAWFANCHYPFTYTITAPGHTSLVTGTNPSKHGIVGNEWYDRANAANVESVSPPPGKKRSGLGPYRRTAETVGDVLLRVLLGRGRMASLSIKNRAAILMAALRAQICYWFDNRNGQFVTSPYYRDEPHAWAKAFNKAKHADRWLDKNWVRFRTDIDYEAHSGPDNFFAEGIGHNQGQVFPHPIKLGTGKNPKEKYYQAVETSPFGNDLLFQFAKTAILSEKLGQTDKTDLLCVSFSSNDMVGHCWGPDSQEVLDITLRSDVLVQDFLEFLDVKIGKGKYVFAVSADHGVCPLPELTAKEGIESGRVGPEVLTSLAEAHLNRTFLPAGEKMTWFESPTKYNAWVYLNRRAMKAQNLEPNKVERSLADWLGQQPGILRAFTRTELMDPNSTDTTPLFEMTRKSFRPESSGDVMAVLKPHYLFSQALGSKDPEKIASFRTSHGTPHPYDTHVPLLAMGPGIVGGRRDDPVTPQAMAAILAESLRIPAPNEADYRVPAGLFRD